MEKTITGLLVIAAVVLVACVFNNKVIHQPAAVMPKGVAGEKITVDGVELRYIQVGHGQDVLLIHGCPGMIEDFGPLTARLAKKYRVTVYDRPGFGYSGGCTLRYSLDDNVATAFQLMDQLGMKKPVILVGHSYGTGVVLKMALDRPDRVKELVLIGAVPYGAGGISRLMKLTAFRWGGPLLAALDSGINGMNTIKKNVSPLFANDSIPDDFFEAWKVPYSRPRPTFVMCRELVRNDRELDAMAPLYRSIESPVVIVTGGEDYFHKELNLSEKLHAALPGSKLVVIPGRGHYVHITEADEVAEKILKTLKGG